MIEPGHGDRQFDTRGPHGIAVIANDRSLEMKDDISFVTLGLAVLVAVLSPFISSVVSTKGEHLYADARPIAAPIADADVRYLDPVEVVAYRRPRPKATAEARNDDVQKVRLWPTFHR